ncbi:MAG: undecaprenyl-phosphate glucose phosphotransferase [Oscillospiraceae bacterium]
MVKENQKLLNTLNVISDIVIAFAAITISYLFVFNLLDFDKNYPFEDYLKLAVLFVPIQLITFGCMGLYGSFRTKNFSAEFNRLVRAFILDGVVIITLLYLVKVFEFSRWALIIFFTTDLLLISVKRFILRRTLKRFRESGYNKKYVAIIGCGSSAREYLKAIRSERSLGFECAGYIADGELAGAKRLGGFDDIFSVLDSHNFDEVVCALDNDESSRLDEAVEACERTGTKISVVPMIYKYMSATPSIDVVGGIPMMNIRRIPLDNIGSAFLKRATDIIGSLVLIILTSPIMLVSAIIIKATMGGKVIFKQERVGLNKKLFTMYKLKSMRDSGEENTAWSKETDPRRTKFGAFIRKFSIDELPQLFNVLKGDMSLVGPRPEIPYYVDSFKHTIPLYMIKHQVKPGMTGLAQINGYRGDTSIEKRIEYDIQYIENWNYFLDISILIRTAVSGFINSEKLNNKKSERDNDTPAPKNKYRPEKYSMTNNRKTDLTALAIFLPSVIGLALIPILMQVTLVSRNLQETFRYFSGTIDDDGNYLFIDMYSQCKAFAVVVIALVMLAVLLVCCVFIFRRAEKRSLIYVGASVVYVAMTLASALLSKYGEQAFYGEFDRAEGFYTIACYFVLYLFTMYAFRDTGNFRYVCLALFFCTAVNVIIGAFQFTGNNLVNQEWFRQLIIDRKYADIIGDSGAAAATHAVGALYSFNYVGSFTGLVIPLFTTMAIGEKKIAHKIVFALFDAAALFFLFASSARSGIVALAAALIVGIIVFAKVIIKRWKPLLAGVAAVAVVAVGANFVLDNALFARIPSLFEDVVTLFGEPENKDVLSELPVREITHNSDGSVTFTSQTDKLTVKFNPEKMDYEFTNSAGEQLEPFGNSLIGYTFSDEAFEGIELNFDSPDGNPDYYNTMYLKLNGDENSEMTFYLFNMKQLHLVDFEDGTRMDCVNAPHIGFEGKEGIGSARGYIWSRTLPLLDKCLIVGYGPDTFTYVFPQNDWLTKYAVYWGEMTTIVDKPHNLYLQIFYSSGLIALIAFLAICVVYLVDCFRLYALKKQYRAEQIYGASVMLGIVGYLAAGLFNDSVVSVAPVFWILLGTGCALNTINRRMDKGLAITDAQEEFDETQAAAEVSNPIDSEDYVAAPISEEHRALAEQIRTAQAEGRFDPRVPQKTITRADVKKLLEQSMQKSAAFNETAAKKQSSENTGESENSEDNAEESENSEDNAEE